MPLYEYRCRACHQSFELIVTTRTESSVRCPVCEALEPERLIGLPAPGRVVTESPATNCRGDGPPCGAAWCGRKPA